MTPAKEKIEVAIRTLRIFLQRRIENTSPDELAEAVINEWAMYAQAGHAQDLNPEFRELADRACDAPTFSEISRTWNILLSTSPVAVAAISRVFAASLISQSSRGGKRDEKRT